MINMSTFGIVVPGRPVDTNFQQVDNNKFLITIPNADSINHVVVFLTGVTPLPPDTASCIFFSLPDPNAPPTWHYLGYLTNDKPSAIYKLSNMTLASNRKEVYSNEMGFNYTQAPVINVAQIGISVEPISSVVNWLSVSEATASKVDTFSEFINKTICNLFNYCSSFSRSANEIIGNPFQNTTPQQNDAQFVPLTTLQNWYESYTRRLSNDPNFWKNLN